MNRKSCRGCIYHRTLTDEVRVRNIATSCWTLAKNVDAARSIVQDTRKESFQSVKFSQLCELQVSRYQRCNYFYILYYIVSHDMWKIHTSRLTIY